MIWLTTKKGDGGTTSLYDGTPIEKDDLLVELYGTVDEAQAAIGFARSLSKGDVRDKLQKIEERLFDLMAHLAAAGRAVPDVGELEEWQNQAQAIVGEAFAFRLPGDSTREAAFHLARTVTRRAERLALRAKREKRCSDEALRYLNRLSDTLYALMLQGGKEE